MSKIKVVEGLRQLGFTPVDSWGDEGYRLAFGQVELNGVLGLRPPAIMGVHFNGWYVSGRAAGGIHFSLPETIDSLDHLKATLAFHLRDACEGEVDGSDAPAWLTEARSDSVLLPCGLDDDGLKHRDHCVVERDWLKFALAKLTDAVENLLDDTIVEFGFDGTSLTIRLPDVVILVQATGNAWSQTWKAKAKSLRRLPKRLPNPQIEVGAWDVSLFLHIRIPTVSGAQLSFPIGSKGTSSIGRAWPMRRRHPTTGRLSASLDTRELSDSAVGGLQKCGSDVCTRRFLHSTHIPFQVCRCRRPRSSRRPLRGAPT